MIDKLLEKYKSIENERFFEEIEKGEYKSVREVYDVVIDVGALAGEFSAYVYDLAKRIYAIEAYSEHFKELEENVKDFKLKKIKPFRLALSGKNGMGKLAIGSRGSHMLGEEGEKVETKTLATFMKDNSISHVDLLKIDIESGEDDVFRAEDFSSVADKIDFIIGEHLSYVVDLLKGYGFKFSTSGANYIFKR